MKIFMDPTFWTLIAFLLCMIVFGRRFLLFISNMLNVRIQKIEHHLQEAQTLMQEAEDLFRLRAAEARDIELLILDISVKLEKEVKFLKEEADKKVEQILENKEAQFSKRVKVLEDQTQLRLKQEFSDRIYEILVDLLKEIGPEAQALLMKNGIAHLSTQPLKA